MRKSNQLASEFLYLAVILPHHEAVLSEREDIQRALSRVIELFGLV